MDLDFWRLFPYKALLIDKACLLACRLSLHPSQPVVSLSGRVHPVSEQGCSSHLQCARGLAASASTFMRQSHRSFLCFGASQQVRQFCQTLTHFNDKMVPVIGCQPVTQWANSIKRIEKITGSRLQSESEQCCHYVTQRPIFHATRKRMKQYRNATQTSTS